MGLQIAASAVAGVLLFIFTGACIVFLLVRWNKERDYSSTQLKNEDA